MASLQKVIICIGIMLGGFLSACMHSSVPLSSIATAQPSLQGCMIGYTVDGLRCLSLQTGSVRPLWPAMPRTETLQVAAPAIDWETSTLYYLDAKQHSIMKWLRGSSFPELVYRLHLDEGQNFAEIEWLLLTPNRDVLLFMLPYSWKTHTPSQIVAYQLYTGELHVLVEDALWNKRPIWLNEFQLLTKNTEIFDVRHRQRTPMLNNSSEAALSPTHTSLLVFMHSPSVYTYNLYDFPDLRLIKSFPQQYFDLAGDLYFVDENHVLSILRSTWNRNHSIGTYLFDVRTEQWSKLSGAKLRGMYYSQECPTWIDW